jgi:hypothetical protein
MRIWNWLLRRCRLTPLRAALGALSLLILTILYVSYSLLIMRVPDEIPELASMTLLLAAILLLLPGWHRQRRTATIKDVIWLHGIPVVLLLFALGNATPVVLLAFAIAIVGLLSLAPPYGSGEALRSAYWRSLPWVPVAAIAASAAWSLINIAVVTAQAEIYSAGRPYCIEHQAYRVTRLNQYPSDAPVNSLAQLRGRRLRSDFTLNSQGSGPLSDSTFNFHALLAIQNPQGLDFATGPIGDSTSILFRSRPFEPCI